MSGSPDHSPITLERQDAKGLVLFIHGIMGSPRQFLPYIDTVFAAGYSVAALLLPGHGGNGMAFARSGIADWESHVRTALSKYAARYDRIVVVGHSMGGLLGMNASLDPNNHIVGLFMIAPPVQVNLTISSIKMRAGMALLPKRKDMWDLYMDVCGVDAPLVQYATWIWPFASLKRLIEKSKRNMPNVTVPVFFVHSSADESVSFRSSDSLHAGLVASRHDRLQLHDSTHCLFPDADMAEIKDRMLAFLDDVCG